MSEMKDVTRKIHDAWKESQIRKGKVCKMTEEEMMTQYDLSPEELDKPMSEDELRVLEQSVPCARAIGMALHLTWLAEVQSGRSPDEDVSPGEPLFQTVSALLHAIHLLKKER